jgi:protein involved in polysaccharide export with SLBB domain
MVRSSDACCVMGLKSTAQATLFGLACAALGAVVASYCWASMELDVAVSPRLVRSGKSNVSRQEIGRGVNSGAGLVGEFKVSQSCCSKESGCTAATQVAQQTDKSSEPACCKDSCPASALQQAKLACNGPFAVPFVPLHKRPEYCASPPDILMVKIERLPADGTAESLPLSGEYLIGPAGDLVLGESGKVHVEGLTMAEVASKIRQALDTDETKHRVEATVFSQNSKVAYVVTEGAALGDTIARFPLEGNETALDLLVQSGRISQLAHRKVWISRPTSGRAVPDSQKWKAPDYRPVRPAASTDEIIPVSWNWTSPDTMVCNNPALLPGDRIFIASPPSWMAFIERASRLAQHLQANRATPAQGYEKRAH